MDFKLKKSNLNFRVYTAASIPSTGNENDIVIISEVPMTNWIMSPDKPSGAPRTDGDVWIQYSVTGNTCNVLKNNIMVIATISAWQYVDDAWVNKTAMSYQNGEWVNWWNGQLYTPGDEWEASTGGWNSYGHEPDTIYTGMIMAASRGSDSLTFSGAFSGNKGSKITHDLCVDMTRFNTLSVDMSATVTGNSVVGLQILDESGVNMYSKTLVNGTTNYNSPLDIDVSGFNRKCRININCWNWNGASSTITVTMRNAILSI